MRNHADVSSSDEDVSDGYDDKKLSEEFRICSNDYYRDSLFNVEDQVETSKLVLRLVTESRFNMTQINGQRKLGGPPPGWKGPPPGPGCEVFVGKIPRTLYEHEIYPVFRNMGEVYEIRLMMDFSGTNRGYCFVMYGKPEFAQKAIRDLNNFEIRPGRRIGVVASINNCRLYVGQLPTQVTSETVIRKIYDITDDVAQVSVYRNANDQARYALISYRTHRGAAMARRRLVPERASLFGGAEVSIDWAHPSMFPSNVVEDTGTCDDQGNIEISRLVVGNENKRYQNRRRARDDFLDHSIRDYLQTDRVSEQSLRAKQNPLQNNSSSNHSLDSVGRDLINFHIFDQNVGNSNLMNPKNYCQRFSSRPDSEINSRESNCSFDLNGGSGSSESSGRSSQSSAASEKNQIIKSQIYYPVENNDEDSNDQKSVVLKTDRYSLNLFDNYTFSADSQERSDIDDNQTQDTARDVFFNVFENRLSTGNEDDNYRDFSDRGGENISAKNMKFENDRKLRLRNRPKNGVRNFPNEETSRSSNFQELETFSKSMGVPPRNETPKSRGNYFVKSVETGMVKNGEDFISNSKRQSFISQSVLPFYNFSRFQNRSGINSVRNKNSRNSESENFSNQQNCHFFNAADRTAGYPHNFPYGINSNAKKAWLSQLALNASNLSGNYLPPNSIVYLDPNSSSHTNFSHSQSLASSFTQNSRFQIEKNYSTGKNPPKSGRPILSRSWASRCDEN